MGVLKQKPYFKVMMISSYSTQPFSWFVYGIEETTPLETVELLAIKQVAEEMQVDESEYEVLGIELIIVGED